MELHIFVYVCIPSKSPFIPPLHDSARYYRRYCHLSRYREVRVRQQLQHRTTFSAGLILRHKYYGRNNVILGRNERRRWMRVEARLPCIAGTFSSSLPSPLPVLSLRLHPARYYFVEYLASRFECGFLLGISLDFNCDSRIPIKKKTSRYRWILGRKRRNYMFPLWLNGQLRSNR